MVPDGRHRKIIKYQQITKAQSTLSAEAGVGLIRLTWSQPGKVTSQSNKIRCQKRPCGIREVSVGPAQAMER